AERGEQQLDGGEVRTVSGTEVDRGAVGVRRAEPARTGALDGDGAQRALAHGPTNLSESFDPVMLSTATGPVQTATASDGYTPSTAAALGAWVPVVPKRMPLD